MGRILLDYKGPIPLYHQIAEVIRFRIAKGLLKKGDPLPALKAAAQDWGVNFHTVRRAYRELEDQGLVETRIPFGTLVLGIPHEVAAGGPHLDEITNWIRRSVAETAHRFNADPGELLPIYTQAVRDLAERRAPSVYVVECSEPQSVYMAQQVMERWHVEALPWPISRDVPASEFPILSTYFHFNDIRRRWPRAAGRMHFLPVVIVEDFLKKIDAAVQKYPKMRRIIVCEREETMLQNIAIDVASLVTSAKYHVEPQLVTGDISDWFDKKDGHTLALLSPRLWGELPKGYRERHDLVGVRYLFESQALEFLGQKFGWRKR